MSTAYVASTTRAASEGAMSRQGCHASVRCSKQASGVAAWATPVDAVGGGHEVGVERANGGVREDRAVGPRAGVGVVLGDPAVLVGRQDGAVEAGDRDGGGEPDVGERTVRRCRRQHHAVGGGGGHAEPGGGDVAGVTPVFERELADSAGADVGRGDAEAGGDVRHVGVGVLDEHVVVANGGHAYSRGGCTLSGCGSLESALQARGDY